MLFVEANGIPGPSVVQFSDGLERMAGTLYPLGSATNASVVGVGIIPAAGLMHVAASGE